MAVANFIFIFNYCYFQRIEDSKRKKNPIEKIICKVYEKMYHICYGWMHYCCLIVGHIPSNHIRHFLYRYVFLMDIQKDTCISGGCEFRSPWNIHIRKAVIQEKCILDGRGSIYIDDDVVFGSGVHVWTQEHDVNDPYFRVLEHNSQPVVIKKRAWICSDSTILPGVLIEEGAVLASRAVATKNCESFGVYAGIPAKKIGLRNCKLLYELTGKPHWHFY